MVAANSPNLSSTQITTPMLVIHGDRDYRVPIGEALRLWAELAERDGGDDGTMPHKFLYFPDENHWVLSPQHAKIWYTTVLAFLDTTITARRGRCPTPFAERYSTRRRRTGKRSAPSLRRMVPQMPPCSHRATAMASAPIEIRYTVW